MIAGELANSPQVRVIERSAVDKILKEMEIQRSGLTEADAVKIGKGLNARSVLLGGVRRFGTSTYLVNTRAVDVETQRVLGSREVTCENCSESDLAARDQCAAPRYRSRRIFRSATRPSSAG